MNSSKRWLATIYERLADDSLALHPEKAISLSRFDVMRSHQGHKIFLISSSLQSSLVNFLKKLFQPRWHRKHYKFGCCFAHIFETVWNTLGP